MRDGFTRKIATPQRDEPFEDFVARWQATLVVLSGEAAGTEWLVEKSRSTLGRAAECDFVISDGAMSKEYAALEFVGGGFRLRDLGSMNGMRVNGSDVKAADLKSGDRFQLGVARALLELLGVQFAQQFEAALLGRGRKSAAQVADRRLASGTAGPADWRALVDRG